jgi:formate hydrogenlyase transcriptional activator
MQDSCQLIFTEMPWKSAILHPHLGEPPTFGYMSMDSNSQQVDLLESLTRHMNSGASFDVIVDDLYKKVRPILPCDHLAIAFLHADTQTLILGPVRSFGAKLIDTGFREPVVKSALVSLFPQAASRRIGNLLKHRAKYPRSGLLKLLVEAKLNSSLTVPLVTAGVPAGVLWLASRERDAYTREHCSFLNVVARHLAMLLEKSRLIGKAVIGAQVKGHLLEENSRLRELLAAVPGSPELIGDSPPWRKMLQRVELVAETDATVLIRGETGTGKELLARAIHRLSARKTKPFVAVNCGALAPELIASELFGHEKGAFTGAVARKLGRIELAQGGTLFLDEIGELSLDMQVKLLRVLQEREFERVGGTQTIRADARIIAATHRDLDRERAKGRFRDDLFFRINVFPIAVPPLRERKEDLEPLLAYFLNRYARKMNKEFKSIDPKSIEQCLYYHWPGNVRELENLVERSVILSRGKVFTLDPLIELATLEPESRSLNLNSVIRSHLTRVLRMTGGKIYGTDGAARLLAMKPSTLQAKMKKLGVVRRKVN